jgi:hypothetical protein
MVPSMRAATDEDTASPPSRRTCTAKPSVRSESLERRRGRTGRIAIQLTRRLPRRRVERRVAPMARCDSNHSSDAEGASEGAQRDARSRMEVQSGATARARGAKLMAIYPCALDRVRYTSEEEVRRRGCMMMVREDNEMHARRWGRQKPVTRAVCALRAYARRTRAMKRVDARRRRAEEGNG